MDQRKAGRGEGAGGQYGGVSSAASGNSLQLSTSQEMVCVCPRRTNCPSLVFAISLYGSPSNLYTHCRASYIFIQDIVRCTQLIWVATVLSEALELLHQLAGGWGGIYILGQIMRRVPAPGPAHTSSTHLSSHRGRSPS